MAAVAGGHSHALNMLLAAGADVNAQNHDGETVLTLACIKQKYACVQMLVAANGDLDRRNNLEGKNARDYAKMDHAVAAAISDGLAELERIRQVSATLTAAPRLPDLQSSLKPVESGAGAQRPAMDDLRAAKPLVSDPVAVSGWSRLTTSLETNHAQQISYQPLSQAAQILKPTPPPGGFNAMRVDPFG